MTCAHISSRIALCAHAQRQTLNRRHTDDERRNDDTSVRQSGIAVDFNGETVHELGRHTLSGRVGGANERRSLQLARCRQARLVRFPVVIRHIYRAEQAASLLLRAQQVVRCALASAEGFAATDAPPPPPPRFCVPLTRRFVRIRLNPMRREQDIGTQQHINGVSFASTGSSVF